MKVFTVAKPGLIQSSAIALGFFDGVHPGHQVVIGKAVEEARSLGVTSGVVTFRDHPRALTRGLHPLLLTDIDQRLKLFEQLGVEATLVLTFSEELCRLSPREYVENVLVGAMGARSISVGHNHHFGRDREGNPELLRNFGESLGFSVHVAPMVFVNSVEVSSSAIRESIVDGDMSKAKKLLSRTYRVGGEVIKGDGRGRQIGFPTANVQLREFQLIPRTGVYAGRVELGSGERFDAVINVGYRPTFKSAGGNEDPLVEAHLFEFDRDIYGDKCTIEFVEYLRTEKKFDGIEALKEQINADAAKSRQVLQDATNAAGEENSSGDKNKQPA
ncbi:MAG: bifunctional riboflavin kinase/FAD synthetase [Candidatus Obscuribacterales bacterium]|nr:bifunctional riboflavin kinase/FAD synthetase [Candidatus Obscuribacterales bacterium]